jgi:hypothetical protein
LDFEKLSIKELEDFYESQQFQALLTLLEERLEGIRLELEAGVRYINNTTPVEIDYGGMKLRQGECTSIRYLMNLIPIQIEKLKGGQDGK